MRLVRRAAHFAATLAALPVLLLGSACVGSPDAAPAANGLTVGHLFRDSVSGMMLDLPTSWRGRYRVADQVTTPATGLQREVAIRYVRSDSSEAAQAPMLVARLFDRAAWMGLPSDSVRSTFGEPVAEDKSHMVIVRRATENPFLAGTPDALAYDSLMMALFSRPLRATLRAP